MNHYQPPSFSRTSYIKAPYTRILLQNGMMNIIPSNMDTSEIVNGLFSEEKSDPVDTSKCDPASLVAFWPFELLGSCPLPLNISGEGFWNRILSKKEGLSHRALRSVLKLPLLAPLNDESLLYFPSHTVRDARELLQKASSCAERYGARIRDSHPTFFPPVATVPDYGSATVDLLEGEPRRMALRLTEDDLDDLLSYGAGKWCQEGVKKFLDTYDLEAGFETLDICGCESCGAETGLEERSGEYSDADIVSSSMKNREYIELMPAYIPDELWDGLKSLDLDEPEESTWEDWFKESCPVKLKAHGLGAGWNWTPIQGAEASPEYAAWITRWQGYLPPVACIVWPDGGYKREPWLWSPEAGILKTLDKERGLEITATYGTTFGGVKIRRTDGEPCDPYGHPL